MVRQKTHFYDNSHVNQLVTALEKLGHSDVSHLEFIDIVALIFYVFAFVFMIFSKEPKVQTKLLITAGLSEGDNS